MLRSVCLSLPVSTLPSLGSHLAPRLSQLTESLPDGPKLSVPVYSETLPAGSGTHTGGSKALPAGSEALPAGSEALSAISEALSAGSKPLPVGSKFRLAGSKPIPGWDSQLAR